MAGVTEIGRANPTDHDVFGVLPGTELYLVSSESAGLLRVTGYNSIGDTWWHEIPSAGSASERLLQPPFQGHSLLGKGATDLIIVDTVSRRIYVARKDAVCKWTWFLLRRLQTRPLASAKILH